MTFIFGALIIVIVAPFIGIYSYKKISEIKKRDLLEIETKRHELQAAGYREIDKFEKLREILTDAVITGSPPAVEVLKPLVEAIADEMRNEKHAEKLLCEHNQQMAKIVAANEPYRIWYHLVRDLWNKIDHMSKFRDGVQVLSEGMAKAFPNLQLPASSEIEKLLTQGNKGSE